MPPRLNIPPITRSLLVGLIVQSSLSGAIRYRQWTKDSDIVVPYLTLIPQLSIIYPWTFLTTTLVENNVFTLGITGITIYYGGRYLERAWTSSEFAKFLLVVSLIPNVLTFAILVLMFYITGDMVWSLTTISGGIGLQISFLIAFSQLVPAHTVTLFRGIVSLRVPRFPLLYIIAITLLSLTPLLTSASFLLATLAFLTSWTYLRFYKPAFPDLDSSQPSSLRGDASESFALAEFFPDPLRGPVAALSASIYSVLILLHICTPFSAADISQTNHSNSNMGGGGFASRSAGAPGSTRAETERRRALALKALDQRLHAATAAVTAKPQPHSNAQSDVTSQPKPNTQTAMATQPSSMLGETSYVPEGDGDGDKGSSSTRA